MRIAIYQCEPKPAQVDRNLERLARVAKHASAEGVDLLVCPEMYLTGYNIGIDAVRELAESSDGTSQTTVRPTYSVTSTTRCSARRMPTLR